jgi:hypothetical protein
MVLQSNAQSVTVKSFAEDWLSVKQLTDSSLSDYSFCVRPLQNTGQIAAVSQKEDFHYYTSPLVSSRFLKVSLLPVSWIQQFNSHHPFGWNDGVLIPAKGYQTMVSTGVFAKAGPLTVQIQPELVYAVNPQFETTADYGASTTGKYRKIFAGQSSVRLNAGPFSLGISTENLWWGPGIYSSLIMSNNAPGFAHLTFNSSRPVKTAIGSFEWQLIGGKLEYDKNLEAQNFNLQFARPTMSTQSPLNGDWRYLNGLSVSWQPRWLKGLFMGMNRVFQVYNEDLKASASGFMDKYLPVFNVFQKKNAGAEDSKRRDQLISVFTKWVLPKAHMEVYAEYGWNDYFYDIRDFLMSPTHSAAYIVGFRKIVALPCKKSLEIGTEITHMEQSPDYLVRDAGNWYTHYQITEGYTNDNQIIGAGSGLGNNVFTVTTTWIDGLKRIGLELEKIQNDPIVTDHINQWTDYSVGLTGQYNYNRFLFSLRLQGIQSENYGWDLNKNRFNFHGILGINYLW